ncbi:CHAT domain-containing protein [Geitlerinema sp. PCC 9228]|uniref:CHAT domain-containing protein n=1 Tax=Geitlerinema sp. PCC 9228 TaxID=111611 RepID=UPI0008F9BA31|nr:CHAT domain-containing protein [Geitlerinema sp. PCC 9228]
MTQEFHLSVTQVGNDEYLVRTEKVAPGVPLAEEQVVWPVDQWLDRVREASAHPLVGWQAQTGSWISSSSEKHRQGPAAGGGFFDDEQEWLKNFQPEEEDEGDMEPDDEVEEVAEDASEGLVALGRQLYDALFQGTIRDSWLTAQGIAQHRRELLRLRLGLKSDRLSRLPWETLRGSDRTLATGTDITFCRYQPNASHPQIFSTPTSATLRVLMVLSAPSDRENLKLKEECEQLRAELQPQGESGSAPGSKSRIQLTILEQPNRQQLTQALEQGQYQVLHYAGHGGVGPRGGYLYLVSGETGLTETLRGDDLAGLLANNGIQLAVFNSCRGAYTPTVEELAGKDPVRSLAESLVVYGMQAVLAMAERIPDEVALTLSRLFYRNLAQGYPIDLSLNRARQGLISAYGSHQIYWALPTLHLHPEFDGYLSWTRERQEWHQAETEAPAASAATTWQEEEPSTEMEEVEWGGLLEDQFPEEPDYADDAAVVADLLKQLTEEPSPSPDESEMTTDAGDESHSLKFAASEPLPQQTGTPAVGENRQPQLPQETGNLARRSPTTEQLATPKPSPTPNSSRRRWWYGGAVGGALAVALAGGWIWHNAPSPNGGNRLTNPSPPVVSQSPVPEELAQGSTSEVVAAAIEDFSQNRLEAGAQAVVALLDRGALQQAKAALSAASNQQQQEPLLLFLRGRLAWQFAQADNPDYSADDARRYWEAATNQQSNVPEYQNALGFAYYANGNYEQAANAWVKTLKLLEERPQEPAALTAYAGSALVLLKTADEQPPAQRQSKLERAVQLRQTVIQQEPLAFTPNALADEWMWNEAAVADWQALLQVSAP